MYELDAQAFVTAFQALERFRMMIFAHKREDPNRLLQTVTPEACTEALGYLREVRGGLIPLQATLTDTQAERLERMLKGKQTTYEVLAKHVDELTSRLRDEIGSRYVLVLDAKNAHLFNSKEPLFGREVFTAFGDAERDIEEAGKCLALRRNKGAVFHLMLAMEIALRALAQRINAEVYDAKKDQFHPWGQIVGNMKAAIDLLPKADQVQWASAHGLLWSINKAWRNETMHPADTYSDEEAETIFSAVKNFMRELATLI